MYDVCFWIGLVTTVLGVLIFIIRRVKHMEMSWYRKRLAECPRYDSPTWRYKVSRMPDSQVFAVYNKFKEKGYFDKHNNRVKKEIDYRQMTIFDYIDA